MERALTQDERIRRAELIYARRQSTREKTRHATVNISEPKNFKLLKRVILQAIICILIYFIFYLINTTSYSFSAVTLNKTNEILSSDYDFESIFNSIIENINGYISNLRNTEENYVEAEETNNQDEVNASEEFVENEENIEKGKEETSINREEQLNIVSMNNDEGVSAEEINNVELSETERIKQNYSFIIPVKRKGFIRIWRKGANIKHCFKIS